jgi:hypothetical protein
MLAATGAHLDKRKTRAPLVCGHGKNVDAVTSLAPVICPATPIIKRTEFTVDHLRVAQTPSLKQ